MEGKSVEQIMQEHRSAQLQNIATVVSPELSKAVAAQEGEERTWGGKSYVKQNGKWVPAGNKDPKNAKKTPGSKRPGVDVEHPQDPQIDKHEIAQLTHMKSVLESDPSKAYEIFMSLTPEAQHKVPQDVVDKMVQASHTSDKPDDVDYDKLGKDGKKDGTKKPEKKEKHPLEGKHYKDMSIEELRDVAKVMKVKVDDKMSLAKLRSAVGDAILDNKIQEALKKHKDGKSGSK